MADFIVVEVNLLLDAILCGVIIAVCYDAFRIIRRVIPHNKYVVGIEDFIFWNIAGIYLFATMFGSNYGIIRSFFILGALLGIYIYNRLIGRWFVKLVSNGINFIINIILKKPIKKVIMIAKKIIKKITDKKKVKADAEKKRKKRKDGKHKSKRGKIKKETVK